MCVVDDLYESARPVPLPDVVIDPAATTIDESAIASSRSSPAVVEADPTSASGVVTTMVPAIEIVSPT